MEGHAALYPQSGTTLQDTRQSTGTCHSGRPRNKGWIRKTRNLGVWVVKMLQTLGPSSLLLAEMELSMLSTSQPKAAGQTALHDPLCSSQSFTGNIWILCQRFIKAVTSYSHSWIASVISGREWSPKKHSSNERIKHGRIIFNHHNNIILPIIQMKILRLNNRLMVLQQAGINDQVWYTNSIVKQHNTKVF